MADSRDHNNAGAKQAWPNKTWPNKNWQIKKGAQPLQALVENCLEPSLKAKGFVSSAIHLHWADIVGQRLAPWSEPIALKWPVVPQGADHDAPKAGATLTVKIAGAFALDLQHQAPQIIERVNSFFGWRCVERLILKQGPIHKISTEIKRPRKDMTVEASKKLDAVLEKVDDPRLKAALAKLGVGIMTRK
jgi:hypothetical protein